MAIPTDEDFARARQRRAAIDADWDAMRVAALEKLSEVADLHHFALFPCDLCSFAGVLFFRTDQALAEAKAAGFEEVAKSCIQDAVDKFRSAQCTKYEIDVEMDSHENVNRNFGGNYFYRLR